MDLTAVQKAVVAQWMFIMLVMDLILCMKSDSYSSSYFYIMNLFISRRL